jgi:hypothetical protein
VVWVVAELVVGYVEDEVVAEVGELDVIEVEVVAVEVIEVGDRTPEYT